MDTKTDPKFQEVKDLTRIERIGAHSHIRGLGLNDVRFFIFVIEVFHTNSTQNIQYTFILLIHYLHFPNDSQPHSHTHSKNDYSLT